MTLYVAAVVVIGSGLFYFASVAYRTLPKIAATAVPAMVDFAERHGIDLPFTDYSSLKSSALDEARERTDDHWTLCQDCFVSDCALDRRTRRGIEYLPQTVAVGWQPRFGARQESLLRRIA